MDFNNIILISFHSDKKTMNAQVWIRIFYKILDRGLLLPCDSWMEAKRIGSPLMIIECATIEGDFDVLLARVFVDIDIFTSALDTLMIACAGLSAISLCMYS